MKDLGIADEVAKKTKLTESGYSADRVASGEVELAIQNVSEIVPVKGVKLAGMLPEPLQVYTAYAAGVATKSVAPKEGDRFHPLFDPARIGRALERSRHRTGALRVPPALSSPLPYISSRNRGGFPWRPSPSSTTTRTSWPP